MPRRARDVNLGAGMWDGSDGFATGHPPQPEP